MKLLRPTTPPSSTPPEDRYPVTDQSGATSGVAYALRRGSAGYALDLARQAETEFVDHFADRADGAPPVSESGHPYTLAGPSLAISGGKLTLPSGTGAGYASQQLRKSVRALRARWTWSAGDGTGSILLGAFATEAGAALGAGGLPDSPCHLSIWPNGWDYAVIAGGVYTSVGGGTFATPLAADDATVHSAAAWIDRANGVAYVLLPDGTLRAITHASIKLAARWSTWEVYRVAAGQNRGAYTSVAAESVSVPPLAELRSLLANPFPPGSVDQTGPAVGKVVAVTGTGPTRYGLAWPYTDEMARDAIGAAARNSDSVQVDVDDPGDTITLRADLPEVTVRTTAEATPANLRGKMNRYNADAGLIVQPLPPAVAGAEVGLGLDSGVGLRYVADGSDVIGSGAGVASVTVTRPTTRTLRCTTSGRWREKHGAVPHAVLDQIAAPYGLALGRGTHTVPLGGLGNIIGNQLSNVFGTADNNSSSTYRTFHPLADPKAGSILPVFTNNPNPSSLSGDFPAPNAIIVAAAVELSDGTVVPFTFNGQHTVTIPAGQGFYAIPDNPIAFGAQVTDATWGTGVILRTYVTVPLPTRVDTVGLTSGSATVTDPSITAADQGRLVKGTGIPTNAYVGTVTPGTGFLLSSRPDSQVNVNATATNASASATILSVWPLNYGLPTTANSLFRYNGQNGADLTVEGSTGGAAAAFSANSSCYGPALLLGPAPSARKPIALCMSDSIFAAGVDQWVGPVARGAALEKLPFVRMSKVSETALGASTPLGRKYRAAAIPGCTHAMIEYGTNDGLDTTPKVALIQGYITALVNYLTSLGIKVWAATIPPKTSSTDGFATAAGQTTLNLPANLASYNSWLRGLPAGLSGVLDLHDLVATGRDTGLWAPGANSRRVTDAATTSGSAVVTSASGAFSSADVGTGLFVAGALINPATVISSVQSATQATASLNASATVSGAVAGIGAWYSTQDGLHPSVAMNTGPLTAAVRALMATWTL